MFPNILARFFSLRLNSSTNNKALQIRSRPDIICLESFKIKL